jgi:hypothetical protein
LSLGSIRLLEACFGFLLFLLGLRRYLGFWLDWALRHSHGSFHRRRFRLLLWSGRTGWSRGCRRFISLDEVLGEDTLLLGSRAVCVFAIVPLGILLGGDGYDLTDWEAKVVIVARSILEDRSNRKRRVGHLAKRPRSRGGKR